MAAKKKVQRVEETVPETSATETKETNINTKARIENGAVVLDGKIDVDPSTTNTETNGVKKTKAAVKNGAVVLSSTEETVQDPPKRKRGRPRKVRLEDGVVLLDPPTKEETEE